MTINNSNTLITYINDISEKNNNELIYSFNFNRLM